jgi:prepilin-type N-terminal cleavage/methylation domain-containing protein
MESIKSILKNKKGFTLVEVLVCIALFGIISVALINVFVASIKSQSRIIYSQELLEQSSYVLEYMNSKIRMAIKDVDGSCITIGSTYNIYGGGSSIRFISYNAFSFPVLNSGNTLLISGITSPALPTTTVSPILRPNLSISSWL